VDNNIWTVFDAVAGAVPDRPALTWRGNVTTYAELADRSRRFANVLGSHEIGLHRERDELAGWESGQDLVGMYMLNGPEFLEVNLGGYGARAAPFNVNYRYVAEELAYLLNDAGAAAVVYHSRFAPTLRSVLERLHRAPLLVQVADDSGEALLDGAVDYEEALASASPELSLDHSPDDLYVLYTGGTTGMPKGTLWRQADIWAASLGGPRLGEDIDAAGIAVHGAQAAAGRFLPNAPFMHGAAQWLSLACLNCGDTVVINDVVDHLDPKEVWTTIERERVDSTLMVGDAFARPLLDELESGSYDASSLKIVIVGGAFTSPEAKARLLEAIPHALIVDAAGASETGSALTSISSAASKADLGVFMPGPTVRVLNEERNAYMPPGDESVGWFAKSGRIPLGYLGDKAKTAATFGTVDGLRYVVVGDRARLRADGMVELLGRDSVTINSGGEKIFAEEVEQAILNHPDVVDVVVTGRPSERWGNEVVAVIELREGAEPSDEAILSTTAERIARYKLPKAIVRVEKVLRSPAGKADYKWAQQQAT
jgi:fatty-acyl-CoA synthase